MPLFTVTDSLGQVEIIGRHGGGGGHGGHGHGGRGGGRGFGRRGFGRGGFGPAYYGYGYPWDPWGDEAFYVDDRRNLDNIQIIGRSGVNGPYAERYLKQFGVDVNRRRK